MKDIIPRIILALPSIGFAFLFIIWAIHLRQGDKK